MPPTSPPTLGTSPKQFNHFSPLSMNSALDVDPEMNAILGIVSETRTYDSDDDADVAPPRPTGPLIVYTREQLLSLCRKAVVPSSMGALESWFGTLPPSNKTLQVDDPAIASIGGHGRRGQGGFGEGFGFGGGIGGRGLGRGGTRNIGLRRQPDDPAIAEQRPVPTFGQMGKFATRTGDRTMRLGGDDTAKRNDRDRNDRNDRSDRNDRNDRNDRDRRRDDGDWRRGDRAPQLRNGEGSRRLPASGPKYDDDGAEPAWMNDEPEVALEDPAIASSSAGEPGDNLIKFIPGEDMIAAHKRAMKARAGGGGASDNWRGDGKPLVSFFGAQQAAPAPAAAQQKPREVNVQSYFKQKPVEETEELRQEEERDEPSSAFQSRFTRFFNAGHAGGPAAPPGLGIPNAPAPAASVPPPPPPQGRVTPNMRSISDSFTQQQPQSVSPNGPSHPSHMQQHHQPMPAEPRVDDHMAKLMGLLKNPSPAPRPESADLQPPPSGRSSQFHNHGFQNLPPPGLGHSHSPLYPTTPGDGPGPVPGPGGDYMSSSMSSSMHRHDMTPHHDQHSPEQHQSMMPPHFTSPPPGADPRDMRDMRDMRDPRDPRFPYPPHQYGGPGPMSGELPGPGGPRPFFDRPPPDQNRAMPPPPELLQLLNNSGRPPMPPPGHGGPGGIPPPGMGMLPPHPMQIQGGMYRGGPSPDDLLRQLQGPPPNASSPGYLPMRSPLQGGGPPNGLMSPPVGGPGGPGGPGGLGGPGGPGGPGPYGPPPNMQGFLPPPQPYGYQQGPPPPGPDRLPPGMYPPGPGYRAADPRQQDMLSALLGGAPR